MPIYATTKESDYEVAPEGLMDAVCIDVVDLGIVDSKKWGPGPKIKIIWELEEKDSKGRPFRVNRRFTPSLADKSHLKPFLEAWRGKKFTPEEKKQFDIEKLIGVPCQLSIAHNLGDEGQVWPNVQACVQPRRNSQKLRPSTDYVREKDRPHDYNNSTSFNGKANGHGDYQATDADVPF